MKLGINTNGSSSLKLSYLNALIDGQLLEISDLATWPSERNKGHATALLREVCDEADKSATLLVLTPSAFGSDGMTTEQLEAWYSTFGFKRIQDKPKVLMCREPKRSVYDIETDTVKEVSNG